MENSGHFMHASSALTSTSRATCLMQWSAEMNALITTAFFGWLVGPMDLEQLDVDFKGKQERWKSKVQIKKCRYLEQSGCVGMCINMCKVRLRHQCWSHVTQMPLHRVEQTA